MDRREKEVIALLGLILSVIFMGWTIIYAATTPLEQKSLQVSSGEPLPIEEKAQEKPRTQEEEKIIEGAKEFSSYLVRYLLETPNFEYVFDAFEDETKSKFDYDYYSFRDKLLQMFQRYERPESIRQNSEQSYNTQEGMIIDIKNIIRYQSERELNNRILRIVIRFKDNKYSLVRIEFNKI